MAFFTDKWRATNAAEPSMSANEHVDVIFNKAQQQHPPTVQSSATAWSEGMHACVSMMNVQTQISKQLRWFYNEKMSKQTGREGGRVSFSLRTKLSVPTLSFRHIKSCAEF